MADSASANEATWNAYITKHNSEPTNAQQLLNFSKNKANNVTVLSFSNARKTFNRNKGKGKINIDNTSDTNNATDTNLLKTELSTDPAQPRKVCKS